MKSQNPKTSGQRGMRLVDYSVLTKKKPEKRLTKPLKKRAGRASSGKISVRHKGGGNKRKYRVVDFGEEKLGSPARVEAIEYDPNRSAFIMLLSYEDGDKRYRLAPAGVKVGDKIVCKEKAPTKKGNRLKLKNIPRGSEVFNIEFSPNQGGRMCRSAGSVAKVLSREGGYVSISLPSREIRKFPEEAYATLGQVSNVEYDSQVLSKAGKSRNRGIRPTVRGSAMNTKDHPHGGGEGRAPIGLKYPKTKWGKIARGVKTRKKNKWSKKFIVQRRRRKR